MWRSKRITGDQINLMIAPYTDDPEADQETAPTGTNEDGWWSVTDQGYSWDELMLALDSDATDVDVTVWFYIPDFKIVSTVGRHVPGRMEEDIPDVATGNKGRLFRITAPPMATFIRPYRGDQTGGTYVDAAIWGVEEVK